MRNFIKYWLPAALVATLIFVGSSIPGPPLAPVEIPYLDKGAHLVEYALLSFFLKRALNRGESDRVRRASLWVVIWAILYGISDELHQSFVPNRQMSGFDLLADGLGAILGQGLYRRQRTGLTKDEGRRTRAAKENRPFS